MKAYGIEFSYEASTFFSAPSDLQVYAAAINATLDNLRAHLQGQVEAHQRFKARLKNTNKNIALNNQKTDQIHTPLFSMKALL